MTYHFKTKPMSKKKSIEQQKILVLTSLIYDYSEDYDEVNEICGDLLNDLYGKFKKLRKDNYIQVLSSKFEDTANELTGRNYSKNTILYCCVLLLEFSYIKSLSERAVNLTSHLEKMSNDIQGHSDKNNVEMELLMKYKYKTDTIIRKNHIKINDKY